MNRREFCIAAAVAPAIAGNSATVIGKGNIIVADSVSRHLTHVAFETPHGRLRQSRMRHGVVVEGHALGLIMTVNDGVSECEIREAFAEAASRFKNTTHAHAEKMLRAGLARNGIQAG